MSPRTGELRSFLARAIVLGAVGAVAPPPAARASSLDLGGFEALFGEPVTTSVIGIPMRESDVPINMTIVTADDIVRSGARDIPTILRQYAGFDVIQWTPQQYDATIRGYSQVYNPRLLVMIDGRQVYLDHYGMTAWSALPVQLSEIRQIEVVRGPNTALFGFNAVSGVINIVTYNPLYDERADLTVAGGSENFAEVSGYATLTDLERYGFRLSGGSARLGEHGDPFPPAASAFEIEPRRRNIALDGVVAIGPDTHVEIDASAVDARYQEIDPNYAFSNSEYQIGSLRAQISHDGAWGFWKASAYRNHLKQRIDGQSVQLTNGEPLRGSNTVTVIGLENQFKAGADHSFRLYGEARHNELNVEFDIASIAGAWQWRITDALTTIASARYDHLEVGFGDAPPNPWTEADFGQRHDELNLNLAAAYRLGERDRLRFAFARGSQTPSLFEVGLSFPPLLVPGVGPIVIAGNPNLEPTTVTNFEITHDHDFEEADLTFRQSYFFQQSRDVKSLPTQGVFQLVNGQPAIVSQNIGDSDALGAEFELAGRWGAAGRWAVNYSFVDIDDDILAGFPISPEDTSSKHILNFDIGYDWRDWRFDLFGHWRSARRLFANPTLFDFELEDVDAYANLDARIAWSPSERIELALRGENLLASSNGSTGVDIDRRVYLTLRWAFE